MKLHGGSMDADTLHDFVWQATGSKAQAERAFKAKRAADLKATSEG